MATFAIVGNINVETTVRIPAFPLSYAPTIYARFGINSSVSAVGYNLAKALTTLGSTVAIASIVGQDFQADFIRNQLADDQISSEYIVAAASQSAQSIILYDPVGNRCVLTDLKDVTDVFYPVEQFVPALRKSDLVVLTNIAYSKPFIPLAHSLHKPIATDLHTLTNLHDTYNLPFLQHATILFMSGELLSIPPDEWVAAVLTTYPAQIVVIGLGARGAYLAVRDCATAVYIPAITTRPAVQTGGAGDALFAAFLHSYLLTKDPVLALRIAVVFASYKVGEIGSSMGFLDAAQLETLAATIYKDA